MADNKLIVAIDSQRLDAMQNCLKAFDYRFNKNLVPINTPDYLERGSLIHEMLAAYYKLRKYRTRWSQNNKNYGDIVQTCILIGRHKGVRMQIDISEIEDCIRVFTEYTELWENDGWYNIVAVEAVGAKTLYESEAIVILYEVKIDLVLNLSKIIPVDHKHSKSRRDPNELSNQFKGYCWFLGSNNLIVNEIGFQTTIKPVDKFLRHTLSFSDAILNEWKDNSIETILDYIEKSNKGKFPRNFTSCDKFSGCDYKYVCKADPGELREYKLRREFKERTWDVGKEHL